MDSSPPRSDWRSLRSIYYSNLLCSLGFFFVSFILPITASLTLGADAVQVGLIFAFLTLGTAIFSPIAGKVAKVGRRRVTIAIGAIARGFSYMGMATGVLLGIIDLLIINSLIWGCGAAFYWVGSDSEISERVLEKNRAEAFGRRQAASAQGSVIGAIIGFSLIFTFNEIVPFLFFAAMNILGGIIVIADRVPSTQREFPKWSKDTQAAVAVGIAALVIAAAIDAFGMALLAPFVELFIIDRFTSDLILVALIYLPPGIISSIVGGQVGRYADKSNKVLIVAFASFVGFLTNVFLVIAPDIFWIAVIFSVQNVIGVAGHTVMASVFGTAYEGRAEEGFGLFGGVLAFARFIAPIIGGMIWISINPAAPFLLVGTTELLLVPVYYLGMRKYQAAVSEKGLVEAK